MLITWPAIISCGFLAITDPPKGTALRLVKRVEHHLSDRVADLIAGGLARVLWFVIAMALWVLTKAI